MPEVEAAGAGGGCGDAPQRYFCHLLTLDLDLELSSSQEENSSRPAIVAAATCDSGLFLAFDSGCITAYRWQGEVTLAVAPSIEGGWQIPSGSGCPHVLAAVSTQLAAEADKAATFAVVGSQTGSLVQAGATWVGPVSEIHTPAAVTAVLLVPQAEFESAAEAFYAEGTGGTYQAAWLFSGDSAGKVYRTRLDARGQASPAELCGDLQSSVLSIEGCRQTGQLLLSTLERIAILPDAMSASRALGPIQWVGSKPHKGEFTATFCRSLGSANVGSIVSARPGGRLWVVDGTSGAVQSTLKFQDAAGEEKASLARLTWFADGFLASWSRSAQMDSGEKQNGKAGPDAGTTRRALLSLLDLEAIAVSKTWSLPPFVDAALLQTGILLIAHSFQVQALLAYSSPLALLRAALTGSRERLCADFSFLTSHLILATTLRGALATAAAPLEILDIVEPLVDHISEPRTQMLLQQAEAEAAAAAVAFQTWVSEMEDAVISSTAGTVKFDQLPLANFPVADGAASMSGAVDVEMAAAMPALPLPHSQVQAATAEDEAGGAHCSSSVPTLTPSLCQWCSEVTALQKDAACGSAASQSAQHTAQGMQPHRLSSQKQWGKVMANLSQVPFASSDDTLQYLNDAIQDLVAVLEQQMEHQQATPSDVSSEAALLAAHCFELLCLYAVPVPLGSGHEHAPVQSAWPLLGALPGDALQADEASLETSLATMGKMLMATLQRVHAAAKENSAWLACSTYWTPSTAMSFCNFFLSASSVPVKALDRCLFRVNGLVAASNSWLIVHSLLYQWMLKRNGKETAAVQTGTGQVGGTASEESVASLHMRLENELAFLVTSNPSDLLERGRALFDTATRHFPQVLPWNVLSWLQSAQRSSPSGALHAVADFLWHGMLQYLLSLRSVCQRLPSSSALSDMVLLVALHGLPATTQSWPPRKTIYFQRHTLVDELLKQSGPDANEQNHARKEWIHSFGYPLALLPTSEEDQVADATFEAVVLDVFAMLEAATAEAWERHPVGSIDMASACTNSLPNRACLGSLFGPGMSESQRGGSSSSSNQIGTATRLASQDLADAILVLCTSCKTAESNAHERRARALTLLKEALARCRAKMGEVHPRGPEELAPLENVLCAFAQNMPLDEVVLLGAEVGLSDCVSEMAVRFFMERLQARIRHGRTSLLKPSATTEECK